MVEAHFVMSILSETRAARGIRKGTGAEDGCMVRQSLWQREIRFPLLSQKCGELSKQNNSVRSFRRRFFVMVCRVLRKPSFYFKGVFL